MRRPTDKDLWNPNTMEAESSKPLKITFTGPADHWTDALPIGNGRLGAMVWGGVASETIQLNGMTKILSCIVFGPNCDKIVYFNIEYLVFVSWLLCVFDKFMDVVSFK